MSEAILVREAYKKFGNPDGILWKHILGVQRKIKKEMDNHERSQIVGTLIRLGLDRQSIYSPMETLPSDLQQKVVIARALISRPRLLLLDELTLGLDSYSKAEVQAMIQELRRDFDITILLTTRDRREAEHLCDRIAVLDHGKVIAVETTSPWSGRNQNHSFEPEMENEFYGYSNVPV